MQTGAGKPSNNDDDKLNSFDKKDFEDISSEENNQRGGCKKCVIIPGATGPAGPPGPMGATGATGATGPIGPTGATGPPGEGGTVAATIPFSIAGLDGSSGYISTDTLGNPELINFAGFSSSSSYPIALQPGDWDARTITIGTSVFYPISFIMPFDGILRNIHVLFANRSPLFFEDGVTMTPFVCIAVSNSSSLVFTIINDTITYTEPYLGGDEIQKYSLRRGSLTGLNIAIAEGTLVGIVMGWLGGAEQAAQFSISGGLFLE